MKNKKKNKIQFINPYSPYMEDESENIGIWFERYKNDPENTTVINGMIFNKIIYRCNLYIRGEWTIHITFVPDIALKIGDTLIDENGLEFTVRSIEMIRFACGVPEWYLKALPVVVSGSDNNIGTYLRVGTSM